MATTRQRTSTQAGDPYRAAEAIVALVRHLAPPRHLLLGAAAVELVSARLARTQAEMAAWQAVSAGGDFRA